MTLHVLAVKDTYFHSLFITQCYQISFYITYHIRSPTNCYLTMMLDRKLIYVSRNVYTKASNTSKRFLSSVIIFIILLFICCCWWIRKEQTGVPSDLFGEISILLEKKSLLVFFLTKQYKYKHFLLNSL